MLFTRKDDSTIKGKSEGTSIFKQYSTPLNAPFSHCCENKTAVINNKTQTVTHKASERIFLLIFNLIISPPLIYMSAF